MLYLFSSYEPELFPGLIYRMVKPRIVLLIFVSGKVVLTGENHILFSSVCLVVCFFFMADIDSFQENVWYCMCHRVSVLKLQVIVNDT